MSREVGAGRADERSLVPQLPRIVHGGSEVVGALGRRERVEASADDGPEVIDGAGGGLAQERLELGDGVLDRVEVGRVGREEQELRSGRLDRLAGGGAPVSREVGAGRADERSLVPQLR